MAHDRLRMCRGVQELDTKQFIHFIQTCDQPLLQKLQSTLLIEQFMGDVVLRSRLCGFLLNSFNESCEDTDLGQCEECWAFQKPDNKVSGCLDDALHKIEHGIRKGTESKSQGKNEFHRVFSKAFVTDMETIEILQKVRKYYGENDKNNGNVIKKKTGNLPIKTEMESDIKIKNELTESVSASGELNRANEYANTLHSVAANDYYSLVEHDDALEKGRLMFKGAPGLSANKCLVKAKNSKISRKHERKRQKMKVLQKEKRPKSKSFNKICLICLKKYDNEFQYNQDQSRHVQAFELNLSFTCPLCEDIIDNKYSVTTHFEDAHGGQNVTCCCECALVIPKGNNRLRRHILKFHHTAGEKLVFAVNWYIMRKHKSLNT